MREWNYYVAIGIALLVIAFFGLWGAVTVITVCLVIQYIHHAKTGRWIE